MRQASRRSDLESKLGESTAALAAEVEQAKTLKLRLKEQEMASRALEVSLEVRQLRPSLFAHGAVACGFSNGGDAQGSGLERYTSDPCTKHVLCPLIYRGR